MATRKKVLSWEDGILEMMHYDDATDKLTIETIQDVEPCLNKNKEVQNDERLWKETEWGRKVAEIPNTIIHQWLNETPPLNLFDPSHKKRIKARLNSREFAYLRTRPGRI